MLDEQIAFAQVNPRDAHTEGLKIFNAFLGTVKDGNEMLPRGLYCLSQAIDTKMPPSKVADDILLPVTGELVSSRRNGYEKTQLDDVTKKAYQHLFGAVERWCSGSGKINDDLSSLVSNKIMDMVVLHPDFPKMAQGALGLIVEKGSPAVFKQVWRKELPYDIASNLVARLTQNKSAHAKEFGEAIDYVKRCAAQSPRQELTEPTKRLFDTLKTKSKDMLKDPNFLFYANEVKKFLVQYPDLAIQAKDYLSDIFSQAGKEPIDTLSFILGAMPFKDAVETAKGFFEKNRERTNGQTIKLVTDQLMASWDNRTGNTPMSPEENAAWNNLKKLIPDIESRGVTNPGALGQAMQEIRRRYI
jgi:hypothetical protein